MRESELHQAEFLTSGKKSFLSFAMIHLVRNIERKVFASYSATTAIHALGDTEFVSARTSH
jgi:hypothetical protein